MSDMPDPRIGQEVLIESVNARLAAAEAEGQHIPSIVAEINAGWRRVSDEEGIDGYPVLIMDEEAHTMRIDIVYRPDVLPPFSPWPQT